MTPTLKALTALAMLAGAQGALAQATTAGTAASTPAQKADKALGTNTTGTNPGGTNANPAPSDSNQAVATTNADAPQPAHGANSFTRGQARGRLQKHGYKQIAGLKKDDDGVWRGTATKDGAPAQVWVDYKGNVGQQ